MIEPKFKKGQKVLFKGFEDSWVKCEPFEATVHKVDIDNTEEVEDKEEIEEIKKRIEEEGSKDGLNTYLPMYYISIPVNHPNYDTLGFLDEKSSKRLIYVRETDIDEIIQ